MSADADGHAHCLRQVDHEDYHADFDLLWGPFLGTVTEARERVLNAVRALSPEERVNEAAIDDAIDDGMCGLVVPATLADRILAQPTGRERYAALVAVLTHLLYERAWVETITADN